MNKAAQILLGTAIAIVFPALAVYAAITLIPNPPFAEKYPNYPSISYPVQPDCSQTVDPSISGTGKIITQTDVSDCHRRVLAYNQEIADQQTAQARYDAAEKLYNTHEAAYENHSHVLITYRTILAFVIAFAGIIALFTVQSVPTLVYGLASGAGLIFLGGISALIWSGENDHTKLAESVLLGVFALATAALLIFERRFHPPVAFEAPAPVPAKVALSSDKPQTEPQK